MLRRSTRLSGGSLELELRASPPITQVLKTMSANTNAVLQRTTSASGSKRKADDEGLGTTKKKTTKKKAATGLIISQGPGPLARSSSALGHSAPSTSRPASALAQHPRTSHTPPTSDGESSRRPLSRQPPPPSPPVPAIAAARARGESVQLVDPTPTRVPNRTSSVARALPQSQPLAKGKGKARAPGLGLPDSRQIRPVLEEDAEVLENERWMAGQRSELDARERDNQRRAGNPEFSSRISAINFASSAMGSTPVQRKPNKPRPPANQPNSSSSALSRVALDSIEPVPISDTPVIVRNREIRQASQSRRRSSLSSRAQIFYPRLKPIAPILSFTSYTLSPLLILYLLAATPHPSVPPDTFFRHVDPELPDALRLRQVLCWTTSRASDQPQSGVSRTSDIPPLSPHLADMLKSIQAASSKKIASGQVNTSIGPPQPREGKPLAPNPRNAINAQAISRLEAYNQTCQAEDSAWSELIAAYNSQQATIVAALAAGASGKADGEVELDEGWRKEVELVRGILRGAEGGVDEMDGLSDEEKELVEQMRGLEPKMDHAYESAYRASQFTSQASVYLEHVFGALAQKLRQRTAPRSSLAPRDETGRMLGVKPDGEVDAVDMLRAISSREAPKATNGNERNGAGLSASVMGNGALQKVTPVSAPTPRKAPGTPRASRSGVGARSKKR
ncbi:hypothetical protein FRC06_000639 [Ceratobasidium sp. 370]|nr:hypothetical protein FRC06_000639 [Ceratobasidium sp. 370]